MPEDNNTLPPTKDNLPTRRKRRLIKFFRDRSPSPLEQAQNVVSVVWLKSQQSPPPAVAQPLQQSDQDNLPEQIVKLRLQLQEKEQELQILMEQNHLLGEMKSQQKNAGNISEQENAIAELTTRLHAAEAEYAAEVVKSRHASAQDIIKTHMLAGTSLGMLPVPLLDIAALTAIQLNLLRSLSDNYGVPFNEMQGKSLLTSLVGGSLPVVTTVGLSSFTKLIPGIGTFGGGLSVAVLAGAVIYATGQVFAHHFGAGGTLEDFNSKQWQAFFKQQLQEGKHLFKRKSDGAVVTAQAANT